MAIVYAEHMLDQRVGEKGLPCSQNKSIGSCINGTVWHVVGVFLRES